MYEIIANFKKTTPNKILWVADVEGVEFKLYIPKWRVPEPEPKQISIKIISPDEDIENKFFITKENIKANPQLRLSNIYSDIVKIAEHSTTIMFDPLGDSKYWEIGSPYIPKTIFREKKYEQLTIIIEWLKFKDSSIKIGEIEDKNIDAKEATKKLIEDFEIKMRMFVKDQLKKQYGEDWWNLGVGTNLRENAEKRKIKKEKEEPKRYYDVIDFLSFIDYLFIMMQKKNWINIFEKIFGSSHTLKAFFERISSIRNDLAHNRFNEEDSEKCKTYTSDILKHLPE